MKKIILPIAFFIITICCFYLLSENFGEVTIQEEDKTEIEMAINEEENLINDEAEVSVDLPEDDLVKEEVEGLKMEILQEGDGAEAKNGDKVSVHYTGTLEDGTKFDSSVDKGTPFLFTLGARNVIEGWDLGVLGMKIGEKRKLTIQPELGYGESGRAPIIPPNAVLMFEVELLKINE